MKKMVKLLAIALMLFAFALSFFPVVVQAAIIDFASGSAGVGGLITLFAGPNATGDDIP